MHSFDGRHKTEGEITDDFEYSCTLQVIECLW